MNILSSFIGLSMRAFGNIFNPETLIGHCMQTPAGIAFPNTGRRESGVRKTRRAAIKRRNRLHHRLMCRRAR